MALCISCLFTARGANMQKELVGHVEPNKKKGVMWAIASAVACAAALVLAAVMAIGFALSIAAFVGGPVALGIVQVATCAPSVFAASVLAFVAYNAIRNTQYHLRGKDLEKVSLNHLIPQAVT